MKNFLADTGFLIASYDPSDDPALVRRAQRSFRELFEKEENSLLIVWPVLYETLNTRLTKRIHIVEEIESEWS